MTVIKGTFPVRFRVDGKDGEGLWVRYAVTLDKWDDTLQKSYPSNMFTIPTGDCIYIGIAVGAGNAPTEAIYYDWMKFVGVDGQSFIIRGVCEEVYSYDTFYDEVEKVVGKVYLLEDYDSDTFNALAVRWTNNGAEDLGAVDGDAYIKSSNKVLFVKNKNRWESLGSIQGPKGDPGEPGKDGEDAVSYRLESSIKAINLDNEGYPLVSSFKLTAYMFKGETSLSFDGSYTIVAYISYAASTIPITKSVNLSSTTSYAQIALTDNSGNKLKDIKSISCYLYHGGIILDSFDILPVKAGAAGVSYFPNMRGYWELGGTYQWQGMSRDMVVWRADGDDKPYLYAVKTAGTTVKETLLSPDKNTGETGEWEKADSPFSMLFANFVYTDNASVAGFVWSEEQMMSSSYEGDGDKTTPDTANIYMNGKKGFFRALNAEIRGKINATSGTFNNVEINNSCQIIQKDGKGWFLFGANAQSDRPESWWLGYSGSLAGQFTMETTNDVGYSKLSIVTQPPITNKWYSNGILKIYSEYQTLAEFGQSSGMHIRIGSRIGDGIEFLKNTSDDNFHAFLGSGHGVLNGMVEGFMLNDFTPSSSVNTISPQKGNYVIVKGSYTTVYLPTLSDCRQSLGLSTTPSTKFAMMMTVVCAGGKPTAFTLYGYRSSTYGANCPHLRDNNYSDLTGGIKMGAGDIVRVLITYDGSNFDAYLISHRD